MYAIILGFIPGETKEFFQVIVIKNGLVPKPAEPCMKLDMSLIQFAILCFFWFWGCLFVCALEPISFGSVVNFLEAKCPPNFTRF